MRCRGCSDVGVQVYHPNFEIWDKQLFETLSVRERPDTSARDEWIRRILDAATVFGPDQVIPNFVAGVEMASPAGFASVDEAIASTAEGLDFFMSHGISPRFTTWCPEPLSVLGKDQQGAPLEYYVRLLRVYRDTRAKYHCRRPSAMESRDSGKRSFRFPRSWMCFRRSLHRANENA